MLDFAPGVLLFVILGIVFLCGKGSFLIAGYNTMSPQEKATWDEKALCKTIGVLMLIVAACLTAAGLGSVLHKYVFLTISIILIFVTAIGGVIYISTSKRVKRK